MKTSPNSQATFLNETEFPLMSSQAASRAKTSALQGSKPELAKEPAVDCGPKLSDLLASLDPATSSWRTSQRCLVAQLNNEADGLAQFSQTWPAAGMMRSGKTYQRQPWALPIAANVSGLLPTPQRSDGPKWHYSISPKMCIERAKGGHQEMLAHWVVKTSLQTGRSNPAFHLWVMGFPTDHASVPPLATP